MTDTESASFISTPLTSDWTFKQGDRSSDSEYLPAHDLPTENFRDLIKTESIRDPFKDLSELSVRWVGGETWTYRTAFTPPANSNAPGTLSYLKFEGLDTFASVYMNGEMILESSNMFLEHSIDVTEKLQPSENVLEIVFESAQKKGLELVEKHKEHRFIVHQTEISRGPVRKAQYHWGWDWGPILLSCGPWKPIHLETFVCRLSDLFVTYELSEDLGSVTVMARATHHGHVKGVIFTIVNRATGHEVAKRYVETSGQWKSSTLETSVPLEGVELWWPRNYGSQTLYSLRAEAHGRNPEASPAQTISKTLGFRKVELVQRPDAIGTSFYFRVNNIDMFIGGSCWIPANSFLTRITPDTYRSWVKLAVEGNQNMLRVWGGGIYEPEAFYDAADEFGILVWQDFMFACANYPANDEYLKSVDQEAKQNVRRLNHHPSVVIWAGNNEDYQIVERYGLEYDVDNKDEESWLKTNFPARYIYEHLLPTIIQQESSGTPYHPSSPFGNGKSTTLKVAPTVGDVHQWNVWHGTMEPYQRLPELGGRFISEFGMEAYPHVSTIERWISRKEDRYPGSMAMDFRNKAIGHERRLVSYVAENFRIRYDLEGFTHLTQVMQADAMSWAYKSWRRQWGSQGHRACGGVLVWQLNDCWPTMSWAIIDYHVVPKPAYYAIKRAMQPVTVGMQRKFKPWTMRPADKLWQRDTGHVDMRNVWESPEFDIWVANNTMQELRGDVVLKRYSIQTGEVVEGPSKHGMAISANATTEVFQNYTHASHQDGPFVVQALLYVDGERVASDNAWPDPIKYLEFDDRGLDVQYRDNNSMAITTQKPVKGFVVSEKEGIQLSDNGFDLMPGETKEVVVKGYAANELKWMYIGI